MLDNMVVERYPRQVLRGLSHYIVANGLGPGDRLPPERELAETLGVCRNTVRDALKSLETIGALSRHTKKGSVLQEVDFRLLAEISQFLLVRSADDFTDLFIARRVLEVSALPLAAVSATEDDYERMEAANNLMEAEINAGGIGIEVDIIFHQALMAAAANKFLTQFGNLIQEFFREPRTRILVDEKEARSGLEDHRQIVRLLKQGDVDGAELRMKKHLDVYLRRGVVQPQCPSKDNDEG